MGPGRRRPADGRGEGRRRAGVDVRRLSPGRPGEAGERDGEGLPRGPAPVRRVPRPQVRPLDPRRSSTASPPSSAGPRRSSPRTTRGRRSSRTAGKGEYAMPDLERPGEKGTEMAPTFLDGRALPLGTADADRRALLAEAVADPANPWFARAFVNRVWAPADRPRLLRAGRHDGRLPAPRPARGPRRPGGALRLHGLRREGAVSPDHEHVVLSAGVADRRGGRRRLPPAAERRRGLRRPRRGDRPAEHGPAGRRADEGGPLPAASREHPRPRRRPLRLSTRRSARSRSPGRWARRC